MAAKDSWGRTAVAHAVLSGRPQVFDAVINALREEIRDDEVDALLGLDDDTRESPMKTALMTTSREMETQVGRRLAQLKVRSIKRELPVGCTKTIVLSCKIEATLSLS
ncbi:unnamed protein product [Sphacelaria rigidula]